MRAAACAMTLMLVPTGTARAAEVSVHATGIFGVRWSDNVLGAPDPNPSTPPGAPQRLADVGVEWTPGVAVSHVGARARVWVAYAHPMLLYVRHPLAHQSADSLLARADLTMSPLDELSIDGLVVRSTSTLTSLVEPTVVREAGPIRAPAAPVLRALVGVRHRHEFSERWSLVDEARFELAMPLDGGTGLGVVQASIAGRHARTEHAFDVVGSALYAGTLDRTIVTTRDQGVLGSEARWAWDVSRTLSTLARAGAVLALGGGGGHEVQPTGGIAIGYDDDPSSVTFSWSHAYTPNPLSGLLTFGDVLSLRGLFQLSRSLGLEAVSGTSLAWSRIVDLGNTTDTGLVRTVVVEAGIAWAPRDRPRVVLSHQWTDQRGGPPDQLLLPTFSRNVTALTVEYAFPPPSPHLARRVGRRVDRADVSPGERDVTQ